MALVPVGREAELGSLFAFLETGGDGAGPAALALEGEAGIGKSTLWRATVDEARTRGLRVLETRPAELERRLAHTGLGDLFEDVLEDVLPELTAPRRRALERALLVGDAEEGPLDARALGVAVRTAVELLAGDGVVLAIDDLQWLDASSAAALSFALRRLPDARVRLLWTRRLGEPNQAVAVEDSLDPGRVRRLAVGPLSVGATHRLLREALGRPVPRPTLLRLHEAAGGNPFFALELARALESGPAVRDPTQPLPVPERLEELLSARLSEFEGATREALMLASAQARLTPARLHEAGFSPDALDPAVRGQVIELAQGAFRFTHPLLASVLYQGMTPEERRSAHLRLARLTEDSLARSRHLALAADRPDSVLAATLEDAAGLAQSMAGPIAAAELAEHAIRLTPVEDWEARDRRTAAAVRAHRATGEVERARVLAQELLARAEPGAARAEALALRAEVAGEEIGTVIALQREALAEAGVPPALQAALHQQLSLNVRFREGLDAAEEHAQAAVELAEEVGDAGLRAAALAGLALVRFNAAKEGTLQLAEQAVELGRGAGEAHRAESDFALAHVLVWSGELERAREHLERLYATWSERSEFTAAYALWYLAIVELRAGRLDLADQHAARSRELASPYRPAGTGSPTSLYPSAMIAAHRGDLERARELGAEVVRRAELHETRLAAPLGLQGTIELWGGEAAAAAELFAQAERIPHPGDNAEPNMCWWRIEQVEALLELGRVDEAVARLDAWEEPALRLGRAWALAHARRGRGLVAAARGEVEEALRLLEEAVAAHEAAGDDLGRGRALLALGVARRRARRKRAAREAIAAARDAFEHLGAAGWARRAQEELGRIGGRTRIEGLSPAEQRVADLVAAGRTNAEVAAALFLAERTVASHLTHVYAKLGVRSRTELSRTLAGKVPTS